MNSASGAASVSSATSSSESCEEPSSSMSTISSSSGISRMVSAISGISSGAQSDRSRYDMFLSYSVPCMNTVAGTGSGSGSTICSSSAFSLTVSTKASVSGTVSSSICSSFTTGGCCPDVQPPADNIMINADINISPCFAFVTSPPLFFRITSCIITPPVRLYNKSCKRQHRIQKGTVTPSDGVLPVKRTVNN